jgi:vacuolar protein sorting-associated protein 13A/C
MGSIYLKLSRIGSLTEDLLRIDISLEKATIFIAFSKEDGKWPFRIENNSPVNVTYFQKGSKKQYEVVPGENHAYAWDFPSKENKSLVLEVNERQRTIEITQLGVLLPFKYSSTNSNGVMAIELLAEGPTMVLKLSSYDETKSVYKKETSIDDNFELVDHILMIERF